MIDEKIYLTLYLTFNYKELCFLEDATKCYASQTNTLKEHRNLIENIECARHYSKQMSKIDRNELYKS